MEKSVNSTKELNITPLFDRFFSKARGVKLFQEEKSIELKKLQMNTAQTPAVAVRPE